MTKRQLRDFQKQLRRKPPSPPLALSTPALTPAQAAILFELHQFHVDFSRLYLRASQRMMVAGMKEARTDSPK